MTRVEKIELKIRDLSAQLDYWRKELELATPERADRIKDRIGDLEAQLAYWQRELKLAISQAEERRKENNYERRCRDSKADGTPYGDDSK